jgi:hypothetical protein
MLTAVTNHGPADPDDAVISFTEEHLSLFAAAMLLASGGTPITYRDAMKGDLLERGAGLLLARLKRGLEATGINPDTMLREPIPAGHWERAEYSPQSPGLGFRGHLMDFVERDDGQLRNPAIGLGGTLTLYGQTRARWHTITVANIHLSGVAEIAAVDPIPATPIEPILVPTPSDPLPLQNEEQVVVRKFSERALKVWCEELSSERQRTGDRPTMEAVVGMAQVEFPGASREKIRAAWANARPSAWAKRGPDGPRR